MSAATSVAAALHSACTRLAPDDCARLDAELLLAHVVQLDRSALYTHPERELSAPEQACFERLVAERRRGVPTAYLLGSAGFWSLELTVDERVLVPRPETELLVETALTHLPADSPRRVADVGTGSGAIALALARERPRAVIVATDCSADALAVARANARRLELSGVGFVRASWLDAFDADALDLIVSNPPYIAPHEIATLPPELAFEPATALICGNQGLAAIAAITAAAPRVLSGHGSLLVEHGATQGAAVRALFAGSGFVSIRTRRDLNHHERVTLGCMPGAGDG